ncbi:hypothetical protein Sjap_012899 [Stephania japonica]|uniref:HMA domain-containing protein n=1 Tax=Stephania japonica TaxID=461633 RepID=A0AAP0IWS1_9MAGN
MKKIVLKVSINCSKCKTKVLKAVTKLEGINSVAVDGEKGTVTVVGEIDPVKVTCGLRKTGKAVEIVSVGPNKPPEKPPEPSKPLPPCCNDCNSLMVSCSHNYGRFEGSYYHGVNGLARDEEEENEMKLEVISERPEEPQKEIKEDQPLVLVQPPTLPCILVEIKKGVEVPNELLILKDGIHVSLPKAVDGPFIVDSSKGEGIM